MKLSLAITTYNRFDLLIKSFSKVLTDPRITEIIISDDASDPEFFIPLVDFIQSLPSNVTIPTLYRQPRNVGMALNKRKAVELCYNEAVILLDSDNVIDSSYIDAVVNQQDRFEHGNTILCPSFARPNFNFRSYNNCYINRYNAHKSMNDEAFRCLLNCCNYVVPRTKYLEVFQHDTTVKATDTIAFNYQWLKKLCMFFVVPGMEYDHLVHNGSGFLQDAKYNMQRAREYEDMIRAL